MQILAREVALALAEEDTRLSVYAAVQGSRMKEGKLHFATTLLGSDATLRNEMSRRSGKSVEDLANSLAGVLDLEFYMPVPEHRSRWRGDEDLIVATVIDDDGSVPVAYDLDGNAVQIDPDTPPLTPTLAIVPVEQEFKDSREEFELAGSYSGGDGIYMVSSTIWDDYESWILGDPEFEVHAFLPNANGALVDESCAGEGRSDSYYYDQDDGTTWTGEVKLISKAAMDLQSDADTVFAEFQVWENDVDACGASSGQPPWGSTAEWSALGAMALDALAFTLAWHLGDWEWAMPIGLEFLRNSYVFTTSLNNDDLVGVIEWPPAECWPESTGPIFGYIRSPDTGYPIRGGAKLDNSYADRSTVCDLSASMTGPTAITTCPTMLEPDPPAEYSASYYGGGSGTATYQWVLDGYHVSTSQNYTIPNEDLTEGSHHLEVIVNRNGQQSVALKDIQVTAEAFCSGMDG
jgi:hypothetical protein